MKIMARDPGKSEKLPMKDDVDLITEVKIKRYYRNAMDDWMYGKIFTNGSIRYIK